jgi:hypothetical protein
LSTRVGTPVSNILSQHSSQNASAGSSKAQGYFTELLHHLGIPPHLADRTQHSLQVSYQKYQAFLAALLVLEQKWKDGELPYDRKPSMEHVIETMQSKTFWYAYIRKYFPRVSEYPDMVAWLEGGENAPTDVDVWGVQKGQYGFGDLDLYLKRGGRGLVSDDEEELSGNKKGGKKKDKHGGKGKGKDKAGAKKSRK